MVQSAERTKRPKPSSTLSQHNEPSKSGRSRPASAAAPLAMRFRLASAAAPPLIQPKLAVNEPGDKYEQEADTVAKAVVSTPAPLPQPDNNRASVQRMAAEENESVQRLAEEDKPIQRKGEGTPHVSSSTAATIRSPGAGSPIPAGVRHQIEPHVGANLSGVRVHSGTDSHRATTSLNALAFTHSNHIFLNNTASSQNLGLMAHESTHVVQQGAAPIQRQPLEAQSTPLPASSTPTVQRLLPSTILEELDDYARYIPGYTLFTVVIGFNPLTGQEVARNATNLLEGLMGLVPFGAYVFDKLQEQGILQSAFAWVEGELNRLDLSVARIERTLEAAWDDVRIIEGFDYNLAVLRHHFGKLYDDVVAFAQSLINHIMELIKEAVIGVAEGLLAENKAWALIKKILHHDPLRDQPVEATTVEILEDFLILIGKEQELEQMRERGTLEETAAWIDTQVGTFMSLLGELGGLFIEAWKAIQPENLPQLATNLQGLASRAAGFLSRVWDFALTVAVKVLELIKKALLTWLSSFAKDTPGYPLLTVLLGKDPFTQEEVPRNATNLIRGFMSLIPGGDQQFQQMQETGVIPAAAQRIESAMTELGITWPFVQQLFIDIWNSFTIQDLINPIDAFIRILTKFEEPLSRLFKFAIEVIKVILDLALQLMNFPSDLIASIINNAMQAIDDIQKDPVGFLLNLLAAVKLGFNKFLDNILTHLLNGLTNWLFGQLSTAGIQIPKDLSLESILGLVLQILGLTVEKLWAKLGEKIGKEKVAKIRAAIDRLTGIWTFVKDVQERGVAAIWEYIQSQISNLWNLVLEKVESWIMTTIIEKVTAKLLSMLDPTGIMAVVNSFIAFFNAVQSAIEYFRQILEIVNSFVSTVAEIARGSIEGAAQFLENTLAQSLPVAIGFLANQVGLGKLGERIGEMIASIQKVVDDAIAWLIDQAITLGKAVLESLGFGGKDEKEPKVDPKDHNAMATQAATEMEKVEGDVESYQTLRTQKEQQAKQIEQTYTALLQPGIALKIKFTDATTDQADQDIDFEVVIAPNDSKKKGKSKVPKHNFRLEGGILHVNDDKQFKVGDKIQVAKGKGWKKEAHVITGLTTETIGGKEFIMVSFEEPSSKTSSKVTVTTYPKQWRAPIKSLDELSDEELATENAKEQWSDSTLAKKILNYRVHEVQYANPSGKDWEHIVEQETGGEHSSNNMTLTSSSNNNKLAAYYNTIRLYPELNLSHGITEPVALRNFMKGKGKDFQRQWKLKVYSSGDFNLSLNWQNNGRGKFQTLE